MKDQLLLLWTVGFSAFSILAGGASGVEKLDRGPVGTRRSNDGLLLSGPVG